MTPQVPAPPMLAFYRYTLTLCAWMLARDVPLQDSAIQATLLALLAWLLVNRWATKE